MKRPKIRSRLTPVEDVLKSVLTSLEMPEDMEIKAKVFAAWDDVVGDASGYARPFRFRGATLIVEVIAPVWLTELSMRKVEIINGLEEAVGKKVVEDIRFQVKRKQPQD